MKPDDRIREAFSDLKARTNADLDVRSAYERTVRPPRPALLPVASAAVLMVVVIAGAALLGLLPGRESPNPPGLSQPVTTQPAETMPTTEPTPSTTPTSPATTPDTTAVPPSTSQPLTGDLYRVNTELVEADVDDPVLNVRAEPSASAPIVVSLPPDYSGARFTGEDSRTDDGALWWRVELVAPVEGESSGGTPLVGWVNTAYLLPVGDAPDIPSDTGQSCNFDESQDSGGSQIDETTLSEIEVSDLDSGCRRFVLTFEPSVPSYSVIQTAHPYRVELGNVVATEVDASGLFVTRTPGRSINLVIPGAENGAIRQDGNRLVLDIEMAGSPPANDLVALTQPVSTGDGSVAVIAIARAFEASVGVHIEDDTGTTIEAVYDGTYQGTVRATEVGIQTTDWIDAWGEFAVEARGLAAGSYTLVLDPDSGTENSDNPLRVPFTIETGGEASPPGDEANQLLTEFRSQAFEPTLRFTDEVRFGLVEGAMHPMPSSDLADPDNWTLSIEGWRGRSGEVDLLALGMNPVRVTVGPISHCAAAAVEPPPELDDLRQVNFEPIGYTSCIDWFAISFFLNDQGQIAGVLLDLWEP